MPSHIYEDVCIGWQSHGIVFVRLQDLDKLQTIFSAKPWSDGVWSVIRFLFRRSATADEQQPAFISSVDYPGSHTLEQAEAGCQALKDTDISPSVGRACCHAADVSSLQASCPGDSMSNKCAGLCKQSTSAQAVDRDQMQDQKVISSQGLQIQVIVTSTGSNVQAQGNDLKASR